jgi:hypothetical protein
MAFLPGTSGNPNGRPHGARGRRTLVRAELARQYVAEAVGRLVHLMRHGETDEVKLRAIDRVLIFAEGRPPMASSVNPSAAPIDFTQMSDSELSKAMARLEAFISQADRPLIEATPIDTLRDPVADQGASHD